ncbi:TonB-dependent siderophore receptor [Methylomonas sp. MK1]|uniref:TonB-dependent siderophore receptor n=1 Tax=Methylomonas sp. MK1 TaxID=1131552 RepID=UPI00035C0C30|nr:TonB-dependent receptor [Methylomonas sp. MK1]
MYWLQPIQPGALRKLAIAIALALPAVRPLPAYAAETGQTDNPSATQTFNIPAQALTNALNAFIAVSDWQVGFPAEIAQNTRSSAVIGHFTPQQALQKLLQGTGLSYHLTRTNSVTLQTAPDSRATDTDTLSAVTVTGNRQYDPNDPYNKDYSVPNTTFATKTNTPIMETPLNVQVIPKAVLDDRQAIKLDQAVKYVSGVTTGQGAGGLGDQVTIRGFFNFNYFRNGFRIDTFGGADGTRAMANVQSIEVLKGPAAMLYGRVEPGGMVNVVTKKPLDTAYYALQQQFGSYDLYRTSFDATGPLTENRDLLYRMNISYENSGSFRELVDYEKVFVAPVLQWNISPQTTALLEMEYRHENNDYDLHSRPLIIDGTRADGSWINPRLVDIPRERNLMEANPNPVENKFVGFNLKHQFNDNWEISEQLGINLLDRSRTALLPTTLQADQRTLNRRLVTSDFYSNESYFTTTNLTGHFNTWGLKHTLLIGGDYYLQDENTVGYSSTVASTIDIYNPIHTGNPPINLTTRAANSFHTVTDLYGIYLQDQIKLPYNVHVMGGFRYQNVEQFNVLSQQVGQRADAVTPQVGVLWQAEEWLSLYGNYVENFGTTNGMGQGNTFLPPQTAQQWEVGFKTAFFDDRLTSTIAYYDLTKQNIPTTDLTNLNFSVATGEARSRGVEVDIKGEILPGWNAIATYAYTNTEVLKENNPNNIPVGSRLRGVPDHTATFWTTYDFQQEELRGLKIGAGLELASDRKATFDFHDFNFDGYGVVDLLASYTRKVAKTNVTLQLNVTNLLNKEYVHDGFALVSGTRATWGTPRSFLGSVKVEF